MGSRNASSACWGRAPSPRRGTHPWSYVRGEGRWASGRKSVGGECNPAAHGPAERVLWASSERPSEDCRLKLSRSPPVSMASSIIYVAFGSPSDHRRRHPERPHLGVQPTKSGGKRTLPLEGRLSGGKRSYPIVLYGWRPVGGFVVLFRSYSRSGNGRCYGVTIFWVWWVSWLCWTSWFWAGP